MKPTHLITLLLLVSPVAMAQAPEAQAENAIRDLHAVATNQRVDLTWDAPILVTTGRTVAGYEVYVFQHETNPGGPLTNRSATGPSASFSLTNGRTYAFQVEAILDDGSRGPRSLPATATPQLERDMEYLAAGLVVTWLSVFGYAAWLARREASLDRKLEQLLAHRGGRNP